MEPWTTFPEHRMVNNAVIVMIISRGAVAVLGPNPSE